MNSQTRSSPDTPTNLAYVAGQLCDPASYTSSLPTRLWARLRAEAPIAKLRAPNEREFWSVSTYDHVSRLLRDHEHLSSEQGTILAVLGGDAAQGRVINMADPPLHSSIRSAALNCLSAAAIKGPVEDMARRRISDLVRSWKTQPVFDTVPELSTLAMMVVGDIIGLSSDHWSSIAKLAMTGVAPGDPSFSMGSESRTLAIAHTEMFGILAELVDQPRRSDSGSLVSQMLSLVGTVEGFTNEDAILNLYSFMMGANTTTPHVASHLLHVLATDARAAEMLHNGEWDEMGIVEEALRWASPTNHFIRKVRKPFALDGNNLAVGDLVCLWIGSANRDEAVFAEPENFDGARRPNRHLAFGAGIHYCNGAHIARTVLRCLVRSIKQEDVDFSLAGPVGRLKSNFINGFTSVPLRTSVWSAGNGAKQVAEPTP